MEFEDLSCRELATAIRDRELSAREALAAHYARIDAVNPAINAIVTQCREQAFERAARADQLTASGVDLPPLHGVPMTHKDTHNTKGIRTTHGFPPFRDVVPDFDDLIIERFAAAGVISTGKSNVPEFAAGSHTFNELFGPTANPYDVARSAGGSSGGAAAAIAARIQPLGDGSDMGGSLRNPAAFCNVVGFRPSLGILPVAPARNSSQWLARSGPLARDVADIALAMSVLAGPDPRIPLGCPVDASDFTAPALALPGGRDVPGGRDEAEHPLGGLRVGVSTDFGVGVPVEDEIVDLVLGQAEVFEALGAHVQQACPDLGAADEVFDVTRAFDMATNLGPLLTEHGGLLKPEIRWNVQKGLSLTAAELISASVARSGLHLAVQAFFGDYDVLLCPTTQVLPFPSEERYPSSVRGVPMTTYTDWMRSASLISATGAPAISVPAGFSASGLPVGLQLVSAHGRDVRLLEVALAYEQATRHADHAPTLP